MSIIDDSIIQKDYLNIETYSLPSLDKTPDYILKDFAINIKVDNSYLKINFCPV